MFINLPLIALFRIGRTFHRAWDLVHIFPRTDTIPDRLLPFHGSLIPSIPSVCNLWRQKYYKATFVTVHLSQSFSSAFHILTMCRFSSARTLPRGFTFKLRSRLNPQGVWTVPALTALTDVLGILSL
jgi:hypothetical protein